jgi:membrane protease YdiL (CAAX protease family)
MITEKFFLALLPLWWGIFNFITIKASYYFAPYVPALLVSGAFLTTIRTITAFLILPIFFQKAWRQSKQYAVSVFGYPVPVGNLRLFFILMGIGLVLLWSPNQPLATVASAAFLYTILEELIARSFFIKYDFTPRQFLPWALLSSAAFSLMHWCYLNPGYCVAATSEQLFNFFNHFIFGFTLAAITYKTKRLEPAILIHMLSNSVWALGQFFMFDQVTNNFLFLVSGFISTLFLAGGQSK